MPFWGGFRCFSKNRRVPKHVFLKLTGAMAPVAPMLMHPLDLVVFFRMAQDQGPDLVGLQLVLAPTDFRNFCGVIGKQ